MRPGRFGFTHGFQLVGSEQKNRLITAFWSIPEEQAATSIVLVDTVTGSVAPSS
jgi:hypothetical protein